MRIPDTTVCLTEYGMDGSRMSGDLDQGANAQLFEDQEPVPLAARTPPSL